MGRDIGRKKEFILHACETSSARTYDVEGNSRRPGHFSRKLFSRARAVHVVISGFRMYSMLNHPGGEHTVSKAPAKLPKRPLRAL